MELFGYRKLIAYQKAKLFCLHVYALLKKFPADEKFALCNQLRRSCVSITSNIAEGMSRFSTKDKAHFLEMSYGSLMEVSSQMELAKDLGYITADDLHNIDYEAEEIARLLSGLQRSIGGVPSSPTPNSKL